MDEAELEKKAAVKQMIKELHEGGNVLEIKERFREVLAGTTPEDISRIEEELVKEGLPREKLLKLCDVHIALFKESLEQEGAIAPEGHPVHTLMEEHRMVLEFAGKLLDVLGTTKDREMVDHILEHFKASESHYVREENVLFPYLEKHGITEPPAVMWTEHDNIREMKKSMYAHVDNGDLGPELLKIAGDLKATLEGHFYKENNILFPTALQVIEAPEWDTIDKEFGELGYCCFTPVSAKAQCGHHKEEVKMEEGVVNFETGSVSVKELEIILDTLPVDVSFVDAQDRVKYFSNPTERLFPRSKAVLGRTVQACHPDKSVDKVQRILDDFRAGKRDKARFWIDLPIGEGGEPNKVLIEYYAVRSPEGEYLGCLEVSQNIAEYRKLEGQKRLLD